MCEIPEMRVLISVEMEDSCQNLFLLHKYSGLSDLIISYIYLLKQSFCGYIVKTK